MEIRLDQVPNELIYIVISYLPDRYSINKFINSSTYLKLKFNSDDTWKQMFYQNISDPIINKNNLWQDNYYDNLDIRIKYDYNLVESYEYDYLIIHTNYTWKLINLDGVNKIKDRLTRVSNRDELAFIFNNSMKNENIEILYLDEKYKDILESLMNSKLPDKVKLGGSIVFQAEDETLGTYEAILKNLGYCYNIGDIYYKSSFTINSNKFLYISESTTD